MTESTPNDADLRVQPPPIEYICVRRDHYLGGLDLPDGTGHFTLHRGAWAYCAANQPTEEHVWQPTGGLAVHELRHQIDWAANGRGGAPGES